MFGWSKKVGIHAPVAVQRDEALTGIPEALRSTLGQQILSGLDCDKVPNGSGPFGSLKNPIPVNGPIGEIKYLAKLRGKTGQAVMFHRIGSMASTTACALVDCYELVCIDGTQWNQLYFDYYHPRRSNLAPPTYTLMSFRRLGFDLPGGFGCNALIDNFPQGVPDAMMKFYGEEFGGVMARRVRGFLEQHKFERPSQLER